MAFKILQASFLHRTVPAPLLLLEHSTLPVQSSALHSARLRVPHPLQLRAKGMDDGLGCGPAVVQHLG